MAERGKTCFAIVHKSFLLDQFSNKLRQCGVRHGIVKSGHHPDPRHHVLVCSLGTLRNRFELIREPDWVLIDESHHSAAGTWQEMFRRWPNARFLGLTATPERPDGQGLDKYFDTIVSGPSMADMIEWGRQHPGEGLCDFSIIADASINYSQAKHNSSGEFDLADIGNMMAEKKIAGSVVQEYIKHASGRKFLTFAPTIEVSQRVAAEYQAQGIKCIHLDGKSSGITQTLRDFELGRVDGISSVNLFLEGLDIRGVSAIQQLRPTESIVVYLQSLGRGLRSEPGKDRCIILDHVGNLARHGLPDQRREWSLEGRRTREKKEATITYWECNKCHAKNEMERVFCKDCRTARPVRNRKEIEIDASVQLEVIDVEAIRREDRMAQGMARGVDQLMKIGMSRPRANHIEVARAEKDGLRLRMRELALMVGDLEWLPKVKELKPKALKEYIWMTECEIEDRKRSGNSDGEVA